MLHINSSDGKEMIKKCKPPDDATGYGPIFEEEPVDVVYTEDSPDGRISMNCRARANPPATYRYQRPSLDTSGQD